MYNNNKFYPDYLAHYGVLGMKWGVRRFQPYSSDYKGKGKEVGEAKKKSQRIGWDDDVVIKKGTNAYRVSVNKTDNGKRQYFTVDENDRNFYKGMWPSTMRNQAGSAKKDQTIYEQKYKLKEDLISPSAAKRQKIAADIATTKDGLNAITSGLVAGRIARQYKWSLKEANSACAYWILNDDKNFMEYWTRTRNETAEKIKSMDEAGRASYTLGAMGNNDRMKSIFGEAIVKAGYNMVIDDHGADFSGRKQRVNAPIIALKVDETMKQIGSKNISNYESDFSMAKYQRQVATISGKASQKNFVPNVLKEYYNTKNYYETDSFDYPFDRDGKLRST